MSEEDAKKCQMPGCKGVTDPKKPIRHHVAGDRYDLGIPCDTCRRLHTLEGELSATSKAGEPYRIGDEVVYVLPRPS